MGGPGSGRKAKTDKDGNRVHLQRPKKSKAETGVKGRGIPRKRPRQATEGDAGARRESAGAGLLRSVAPQAEAEREVLIADEAHSDGNGRGNSRHKKRVIPEAVKRDIERVKSNIKVPHLLVTVVSGVHGTMTWVGAIMYKPWKGVPTR